MAIPSQYNPNDVPSAQQQDILHPNVGGPLVPVTGSAGSGQTVVNTQALAIFGNNINELLQPVRSAQSSLNAIPYVAAGAFDKAWNIQNQVTGDGTKASGGADIKTAYGHVLTDLSKGLYDLIGAVQTMVQKYTTTDELNSMKVNDLQQSLDQTSGQFGKMMTDGGGGGSAGGKG